MKEYVPVGNVEEQTGYCPTYLAWYVLDEVRDYLRVELPENYATDLAQRAERVFVANPLWQRKLKRSNGREHLLASRRHWLAGILAREKPALFRKLPESFQVGRPLPPGPLAQPKEVSKEI